MPENFNIKSDDIRAVARGQAVVEAQQMTDKACRVLSVSATCSVTPGEVFAGEARYAGKVRFDCLIVSDGKPDCISAVAEFSDKITATDIAAGMNPVIVPEIINTEASVTDGAIKLVAVVDTTAYAVKHCDRTVLTATDDGIYSEKCVVNYCTAVSELSESAYITDGMQGVKCDGVLSASAVAVLTGAVCDEDEVKATGTVYTTVSVRTDDGLIAQHRMVTPFVKSLSAPGVTSDNIAIASAAVTDCAATLAEDGDEKSLDLALTLKLDATVIGVCEKEAVSDVFSVDCELETACTDALVCLAEPTATVIDTADGQVALEKDRPEADNVLGVTNTFCNISSAKVENKCVSVEGLVGGDIIYYNAEHNSIDSVAFRLPFSMPLSLHTEMTDADVTACVTQVNVKVRRESVFDVKAEIAFTARLTTCKTVKIVESVKKGEAIPRPEASVIVHIARKGETLWQAARALCCAPERVEAQNDCKAPYSGGERLVNFCKRDRKPAAAAETAEQ